MDPITKKNLEALNQRLFKESMEQSCEEMRQKMIEAALKDARSTGEVLGIVASIAARDESGRNYFLAKAKKELENRIEWVLDMSDAQVFMHVFRKSMKINGKDLGEFMEELKK